MKQLSDIIKELQQYLVDHGASLTVDGNFGSKTYAALELELGKAAAPAPVPQPNSSTPWRDWFLKRIGWTEFDHDHELAKGWALVGLPQYNTVIGISHAWCGMSLATALVESGYKIPHGAAGAKNWDGYGDAIDWKKVGIPKGAGVRIRHRNGSGHITTANRDHAPGESVLDALGGNQGDSIKVSRYDVSGNSHGHDEIVHVFWPVKA